MKRRSRLTSDPERTREWQQKSRRRLATRSPLRCRKGISPRKASKAPTVDGDSERAIRDECDELIRRILKARDEHCCIVCGVPGQHETLHPGHYISRKVLALRWDLRNVWPQCKECNSEHNIKPHWYRAMLIDEIGTTEVCELERIGQENPRLEYSDLLRIRDDLRKELRGYLR